MKKIFLIFFLTLSLISFTWGQTIFIAEKPLFLKPSPQTNTLFIEYRLGEAMLNLEKGNFSKALQKLNDAFILSQYFPFSKLSTYQLVHLSAALFSLHVFNFEHIPDQLLKQYLLFWDNFFERGESLRPYEEAISRTALKITKLSQTGQYDEALREIKLSMKILDTTKFFNFSIEKMLVETLRWAFLLKEMDLLILKGSLKDALQLQSSFPQKLKELLIAMDKEASRRYQTLDPGVIFIKGRKLEDFYFSLALFKIRLQKLDEALKILKEGKKVLPESDKLQKLINLLEKGK